MKDKATYQVVPLYTHADPGEVERMAETAAMYSRLRDEAVDEVERLRNCLRTEVEAGDSWKREAQELREKLMASHLREAKLQEMVCDKDAQLAERGALLRAVPVMPTSVDRRPNDEDQPDGYLEGDRSWCDNNKDAVEWLIENHVAIRAAISASAEPSAPIAWHVGGNGYDRISFEKPANLPGHPCIQAIHDQRQLIDLLKRYDLRDEDAPPNERGQGILGTSFQRLNALANQGE